MLPKIEVEGVTDKVETALRDYILSGELEPGTRLVEAQLAEQLGVSRAPVREALAGLEAEGLVVSELNKGAIVAEITEKDLWEIFTIRCSLEGLAARLVARTATRDGLRDLASILAQMKSAAEDRDAGRVAAEDFAFHQRLWELSGHGRLCQMLMSIISQIRLFLAVNSVTYDNLFDNYMEHVELLEALRAGDEARAESLMVQHIEVAGTLNISYLRNMHDGSQGTLDKARVRVL
jgi:DNA-binding GntR family transcriptional regulator